MLKYILTISALLFHFGAHALDCPRAKAFMDVAKLVPATHSALFNTKDKFGVTRGLAYIGALETTTPYWWLVKIGEFEDGNESLALAKAKALLNTTHEALEPDAIRLADGQHLCLYQYTVHGDHKQFLTATAVYKQDLPIPPALIKNDLKPKALNPSHKSFQEEHLKKHGLFQKALRQFKTGG